MEDREAFAALRERHEQVVDLVAVRALDEVYPGEVDTYEPLREATFQYLEGNRFAPLRVFAGRSVPAFLAATVRRAARDHISSTITDLPLVATNQTPSGMVTMDNLEPGMDDVAYALERLPADATCILRLRTRGLDRRRIASALARSEQSVLDVLNQLAHHIARGLPHGVAVWRYILDAMPISERTVLAIRSRSDERFMRHRSEAEVVFRGVEEHTRSNATKRFPMCLDHHLLSQRADGSLDGDDRTWAESHVVGCPQCTDSIALLLLDLEAVAELRYWSAWSTDVALVAACIATRRFLAGQRLAERSSDPRAAVLQRIARVGRHVSSGRSERRPDSIAPPPIAVSRHAPKRAELPVYVFEELARGRAPVAYTAIDEGLAKTSVGQRLQLLACAFGHDPDRGREMAFEIIERPRADPLLREDAQAVLALPDDAILPREIQRERLVGLIPDLVRMLARP